MLSKFTLPCCCVCRLYLCLRRHQPISSFLSTVVSTISKTKDKVAQSLAQSSNKVAPHKAEAGDSGEVDSSAASSAAATPTPSNASSVRSGKEGTLKKQRSLKATATVAEVVASGAKRREEARRNSSTGGTNTKSKACLLYTSDAADER